MKNMVGLISLISLFSPTVLAEAINDLGTLGGSYSIAHAISADGSVVIGLSRPTNAAETHAFKYTEALGMVDLGTLGGNYSEAMAVSANGSVLVGESHLANGETRAFKYTDALGMVDLGTLGMGYSRATGVSADGSVVVGNSYIPSINLRAFKHTDVLGMVDLGTLGGNQSNAAAVSANGLVVVGQAELASGDSHAFKHTDILGMIDLGTLGGNSSEAIAVSANGSVVVGQSSLANGETRPFKHIDTLGMIDLGSLGGEYGFTFAVSANGLVVVGASGIANGGRSHAFKHTDALGMVDLGTLGGSDDHYSLASAVSADGSVVVGDSSLSDTETHAFRHTDALGMVDLGTLGGETSSATAVSADGLVVAGYSSLADGSLHAFIHKTKMIDVVVNQEMLHKSAQQQTAALSFIQDKLTDALYQGCRPDADKTCFSAGAKYYQQSNRTVDNTAAYVNIANSFHPKFYAGAYLEQSVSSGFADSIDANNEQPLVAVYGGFRASGNQLGLQVRAAAATHKVNTDITRPSTAYTEAGKGSSNFNGYSGQLEAAYTLQATDKMIVSPVVGLRYSQVEREAYTEEQTVDLPTQYGKMESKQTSLFAGVETELRLSEKVNAYANIGVEQVLDHSETAFSAKAPYLGGLAYNDPDVRNIKAYAFTGVSYKVAPNQKIGLGVGYRQANFKSSSEGLSAQLGYTLQF